MKNAGKERAILYREFCEWCKTVPHLDLDPRLHTHGGRIEDGGYISNGVTAKAFAAWKAARCAPAAPQPQANSVIDFPHEEVDALAITRYKVVAADKSMFWESAVVAGDGTRQLYTGRKVECENMARKFAGAFAEGAFVFHAMHAPQPQADGRAAERVDALYTALEVCSAELFAQCSHQGRVMKYVEQARKALAAEQCASAAIAKATGRADSGDGE